MPFYSPALRPLFLPLLLAGPLDAEYEDFDHLLLLGRIMRWANFSRALLEDGVEQHSTDRWLQEQWPRLADELDDTSDLYSAAYGHQLLGMIEKLRDFCREVTHAPPTDGQERRVRAAVLIPMLYDVFSLIRDREPSNSRYIGAIENMLEKLEAFRVEYGIPRDATT